MKLKFHMKGNFYSNVKDGDILEVDAVRADKSFASGVALRVIGLYKRPTWIDLGWFGKNSKDGLVAYTVKE